jgi:phosphoribosylanthranilate isomerase
MTLVKLCGMRSERDVHEAAEAGADAIGMVLTPGFRRSVGLGDAAKMARLIPKGVMSVGVFVDSPAEEVAFMAGSLGLKAVQLHGSESDGYISRLRGMTDAAIIKSFIVRSAEDIRKAGFSSADLILLDGGMGSGKAFDTSLLSLMGREYILAGGLTPDSVSEAVIKLHPYAVDVSSGIETDGAKDPEKMRAFVRGAKTAGKGACI